MSGKNINMFVYGIVNKYVHIYSGGGVWDVDLIKLQKTSHRYINISVKVPLRKKEGYIYKYTSMDRGLCIFFKDIYITFYN